MNRRSTPASYARSAWSEFLDTVNTTIGELSGGANALHGPWFRGQPQSSYPLLPSLLRGYLDRDSDLIHRHIHEQEQGLYREFTSRVREFHGVVNEDWDNLFAMQHCGAPTRLIEWTESLPTAFYFALHRFEDAPGTPIEVVPDDPPCLWILNPQALNTRTLSRAAPSVAIDRDLSCDDAPSRAGYAQLLRRERIAWREPVAVHPLRRTVRMQIQRSWFTMHGDNLVAMEHLESREKFLVKLDIPAALVPSAREYVRESGVELLSLYRDLQHIGLYLNRRNAGDKARVRRALAM